MQGGPINFEAFKWHQALAGDPDRCFPLPFVVPGLLL